jgi:NAD(P)H-nitrite reductase large subunit
VFEAPRLVCELAKADTVVCRCEEVTLGEVQAALAEGDGGLGAVKRSTRLGMGRCQGRYCGPVVAALLGARAGRPLDELAFFAPRPAIKPVMIGALVGGGE